MTHDTRVPPDEGEMLVSRWFSDYVATRRTKFGFPLQHPGRTTAMLRNLHRLPRIDVQPGVHGDGPVVRNVLSRPWAVRVALGAAVSALALPTDPADYLSGRSKHALRQKVRAAERHGLRYRPIEDPQERRRLLAVADEYERTAAVASMRNPAASNGDLLPLRYWLLAEDPAGAPLLLAAAAVDGPVAVLRYYRSLAACDQAGAARYGAMPRLVADLAALGVEVLFEAGRPHWIHNGIRQFQRKLGFRLVRVALHPAGPDPAAQRARGGSPALR